MFTENIFLSPDGAFDTYQLVLQLNDTVNCVHVLTDTTVEDLREVKLRVWGEEACRNNTLLSEDSVNTNFTLCAGYTSGMMSGCRVSLVSGNELFLVSFERSSPLACDICCGLWYLFNLLLPCIYLFTRYCIGIPLKPFKIICMYNCTIMYYHYYVLLHC